MNLEKYIDRSENVTLCSQAEEVRVVQVIFEAAEKRIEELRSKKPKRSPEDLTQDIIYILGIVDGLNWVLGLPERSRELRNKY